MVSLEENGGRILVIDEGRATGDSLGLILQNGGYNVSVVYNADEALTEMQTGGFDLVIADIRVPTLDSLEIVRQIKQQDADIVVIMTTDYPTLETVIRAIRYNAYDYLIKPLEKADEVLAIVGEGLRKRQSLSANCQGDRDSSPSDKMPSAQVHPTLKPLST
jgi:two-component system response regulator PilR (NtrC family)